MKRKNVIFAASLMVIASFIAACQKSETTDPAVDSTQVDDQVSALFDDTQNDVDEIIANPTLVPNKSSAEYSNINGNSSGTRTDDFYSSGDTVIHTITFKNFVNGNSGSGHIKNGVIIAKVLGGPLQAKFEKTITYKDFTIDYNLIEGTRQIIKIGDLKYSVTLVGGKVTFTDGTSYTHNYTRTRTWTEGYDTPAIIWDDIYTIEGVATGVNLNGYTYTHTIINPLVIKNSCRWIVSGTIEMVANNKTAVLDYGNGDCDNVATVTVNGKTTEIKLKAKR